MGLLDDAIREHLDLKRRHGADPTELEQAEREALGPVRRDPFEQGEGDLEASAGAAPGYDQNHEEQVFDDEYYEDPEPGEGRGADEDWGDAFDEHAAERPEPGLPAAAAPEAPVAEPTRVMRAEELDEEVGVAEEPATPPPHPAGAGAETGAGAGAETVEYDVEEALDTEPHEPREMAAERREPRDVEADESEPPHEGSEEDVLEETPEFLQDTPDHDRLWFEQRPPKDFDFDG